MTERAAEIYSHGCRSGTSSYEAWDRLKEIGANTEWYLEWLKSNGNAESRMRFRRQYERR